MTQLPALEKSHLSCTDVGCKNFYNNFKEIHVCVWKGWGGPQCSTKEIIALLFLKCEMNWQLDWVLPYKTKASKLDTSFLLYCSCLRFVGTC